RCDIELRHLRRTAGSYDVGNQLTVTIVLHELRAEQARSAVAPTGVGAVTELTVDAVERLATIEHRRIGGAAAPRPPAAAPPRPPPPGAAGCCAPSVRTAATTAAPVVRIRASACSIAPLWSIRRGA